MRLDIKSQFVEELDDIYKTHLIYRTIVVCNNDDIDEYKVLLEDNDFSVYVVDTLSSIINYDALDYRILLIKCDFVEEFLNDIISNGGGSNGSSTANSRNNFYTYIAFTPDNANIKEEISKKYYNNYDIINNII
jgi:hypothetical protein